MKSHNSINSNKLNRRFSLPFVENMASTTPKFILWLLISAIVQIAGGFLAKLSFLTIYPIEGFSSFVGGIVVGLALESYAFNADERKRQACIRYFWGGFSSDLIIVIPTSSDIAEPSPFTPYQDAMACSEISKYIFTNFGFSPKVISSAEATDFSELSKHNLIIIGGPKFNSATDYIMKKFWERNARNFFHWSWHLRNVEWAKELVESEIDKKSHFILQIENENGEPIILDEIRDIFVGQPKESTRDIATKTRGFVLWMKDYLEKEKNIIVVSGVRSAFGTLAAARYFMDTDNLLKLPEADILQVIVDSSPNGHEIGNISVLRQIIDNK